MTHKTTLLFVLLAACCSTFLQAQEYEISFVILGQADSPDSVFVENRDQESSLTLFGRDILLLYDPTLGTEIPSLEKPGLHCYPNPVDQQAIIEISSDLDAEVKLQLVDLMGRKLISQTQSLSKGVNSFLLNNLGEGSFVFSVSGQNRRQSSVMIISHMPSTGSPSLNIFGHANEKPGQTSVMKGTVQESDIVQMPYSPGEVIEFTAYMNQESSNVESLVPEASKSLEFSFPPSPVVDFSSDVSTLLAGTQVHFADATEYGPTSWLWDFGDGKVSEEQHPVHSYDTAGYYTVKLTASNIHGTSTRTRHGYITINANDIVYGIKHGEVYGYINSSGKILLDSLEEGIIGAIEGGKVYKARVQYYDDPNSFLPKPVFTWKCYNTDGTVIDYTGDYLSPNRTGYDMEPEYTFVDGMAIVSREDERYQVLYGFVDEDHQEVIPCQYRWVSAFSHGLAAVWDTANNEVGFVNKSGNYVIPPKYDMVGLTKSNGFHQGLAVVSKDEISSVIDIHGNVITNLDALKSDTISLNPAKKVSSGLWRIKTNLGTGYVNLSGEWEIAPNLAYSFDSRDFVNDYAVVQLSTGKFAFINKSGELAFPGEFFSASAFDENHLAWVVDSTFSGSRSKSSFINESGEKAFSGVFNGMPSFPFVNGYALVKDWELDDWIYINTAGETVLVPPGKPFIWSQGLPNKISKGHLSKEGVALIIFDDNTYGYINLAGDILWKSETSYNEIWDELI